MHKGWSTEVQLLCTRSHQPGQHKGHMTSKAVVVVSDDKFV
jgi:hypothetical protein